VKPGKPRRRDHNAGVKLHGPIAIHCAICLNRGQDVAATTLVKGYAVCQEHMELVSRPNFDIFDLIVKRRHPV
jgi:hypothetical protein